MSSNKSYRQLHEEFVVNKSGTSAWDCLLLVSPYPLLAFFSCYCLHSFIKTNNGFLRFLVEFFFIVIPLVLSLTLFNGLSDLFVLVLLLLVIICLATSVPKSKKNLIKIVFTLVTPVTSRPYITCFRSIVNLISVFCILAVDFKVFPRQFAKTETYGFSLMDTGVGLFIIANGIVTSPEAGELVIKTIKSTLPIIAIGIFRCVTVKGLDYQQVFYEYGTHWNFFFTLAAVKLMGTFFLKTFPNRVLLTSVVLGVIHQGMLQAGVETWLSSNSPRNNPFSANREGICSLLGYQSLFLASVAIGKALNKDKVDLDRDLKLASKGFIISGLLYLTLYFLHPWYPASRRFVNVTYIVWMLAMAIMLLSVFILLEICLRIIYFVKGANKTENLTPNILNSINYNGLLFFLLGNIFTGTINLWVQTMYVDTYNSIVILTLYMFLLCFFVNIFHRNGIKISF